LSIGFPALIWVASKLVSIAFPAALHRSPGQRFLLWISGPAIVEWFSVCVLRAVLKRRNSSFRDLGVWRAGTRWAWLVALLFAAIPIIGNLRFLPRMGIPISSAFWPHGFHLAASLILGITAGFCEEVIFRAFLMTEFANAGYGKVAQILVPGFVFGLAHAGYLNQGFLPWLGIMLPTAFIGMMWGAAYLLGRRSLLPVIVAHFINDATALPWIAFFMVTGSLGRH
jgi:membrane protease YdiL (CAAX protease family)